MANTYPTSSTTTTVSNSGARETTTTTYSYASAVTAKTASYAVLASDNGTIFTTTGAGGAVTFTLPSLQAGLEYTFVGTAAQNMIVTATTELLKGSANASPAAAISAITATVAGGTAANRYSSIRVVCDGTNWLVVNVQGTVTFAA